MIKAIVFDCFGVLITDALGAMVAEIQEKDPATAAEILAILNAAGKGQITRERASDAVAALFGITVDEYKGRVQKGEVKNSELLEYIVTLRNTYKTAMLSNVSIGGLSVRFTSEELERCFEEVVASGEIGFAKPEPRAYEIVAERLGVRLDECVFIDDREEYCEGARSVGMHPILYRTLDTMKTDLAKELRAN
jgi:HAD superfamily hydrolase (TIGR01549 family)